MNYSYLNKNCVLLEFTAKHCTDSDTKLIIAGFVLQVIFYKCQCIILKQQNEITKL